ncbi:eukaryotic translation initiation factor 3 subunit J-like [Cimex lectularius]|uniref:Eukaryotic translation initiation factor 3 30 kDa subunit n=1 Tax=Cimex lectularius TaxID=79782 RepID=A0A8I6RCY8_CIMLE|nr:eukaryotic translation initiation factor 3 subunit J-like [Cimex lectularius]
MDFWDLSAPTDIASKNVKSKWDDEDVEECTLESWDQEEEVEEEVKQPRRNGCRSSEEKGKKVQKKEVPKEKSAEEVALDKLQAQKLQEEADLRLAREIFGVADMKALETKEEYEKLNTNLLQLVNDAQKNANYFPFVEELVNNLCVHLSSTELKKICVRLSNLQIQKINAERGEKKKTKSKLKAKLRVEGDSAYNEYSAYSEFCDDFI